VTGTPGWQQQVRCAHFGLTIAALTLGLHQEGDVWLCTCGREWVVARDDDGRKTFKRHGW
jgi:hypothetical protein